MTTRTIRTRDRGLAILTGPPRPSSPLPRGREKAPGLPPPSFDDLRTVDGWPPLLLPPKALYLIQQHPNADRQLPYGWQPAFEVRPPNRRLDMLEPIRTPRFDPRSMLWWSQWEIVFAKRALGLSDEDTCSVFKYRWREMDRSTKYMQPYHVAQILEILSDGHPVRHFPRIYPSCSWPLRVWPDMLQEASYCYRSCSQIYNVLQFFKLHVAMLISKF